MLFPSEDKNLIETLINPSDYRVIPEYKYCVSKTLTGRVYRTNVETRGKKARGEGVMGRPLCAERDFNMKTTRILLTMSNH